MRASFLSLCSLCALWLTLFSAQAADARPNIVFALADDWSFPNAGVYGDKVVKTPTFDRLAKEGVLFRNCFCASPSCTPARGAILTGQAVHRLESGANLWSILPAKFQTYPDVLEKAGYVVGYQGKGWAPGDLGERTRNPAGPQFKNFAAFMKTVPAGKPFCYWYGSHDPHRPYKKGQGAESGMKPEDVTVPAFLPDTPDVRGDILDYYFAVQRYDRDTGEI
jgi:N-sulfoglucosamine sulfohydrolase